MAKICSVILAGGRGTRLWPLSNEETPKPFMNLKPLSDKTLYEHTLRRARIINSRYIISITNSRWENMCADDRVIVIDEPANRNTTAAVALAGEYCCNELDKKAVLVIMPSCHWIDNNEVFANAIYELVDQCEKYKMIGIVGVKSTSASTKHGYIKMGPTIDDVCHVEKFIEKPTQVMANSMTQSGDYLLNTGIFVIPVKVLKRELTKHCKWYLKAVMSIFTTKNHFDYKHLPSVPIDIALMEKTDRMIVKEAPLKWSSLSTFKDLYDVFPKDSNNNVITAKDVKIRDCNNCLIYCDHERGAIMGMQNSVYISNEHGILISSFNNIEEHMDAIKEMVKDGGNGHVQVI